MAAAVLQMSCITRAMMTKESDMNHAYEGVYIYIQHDSRVSAQKQDNTHNKDNKYFCCPSWPL